MSPITTTVQVVLLALLVSGLQAFDTPASHLRGYQEQHRELRATCGADNLRCQVQSTVTALRFKAKKNKGGVSPAASSYLESIQGVDPKKLVPQAFAELKTQIDGQTTEQNSAMLQALLNLKDDTEKAMAEGTGRRLIEGQRELQGLISSIINGILSLITGIFSLIFNLISSIINAVFGLIGSILNLILNIIRSIINLLTGRAQLQSTECAQSLITCQLDNAMKLAYIQA